MISTRPSPTEESGVVQALAERDLSLADALGKYRLLGALGTGGMADVYLAVADGPEGFRKLCVLKLLKETMADDEEFRAMFLDEARLAARLNHPNIVQTFEVGETHGRLMIAMEYVEGQPISRVRRRLAREQFPLAAYLSVLCDVLEALEYAHGLADFDGSRLGIVHRDVSPHNIILGYDGRVKLVDFGIAKSAAAMQETQAGVLKGKVGYMAPEQANLRDVDGRADVFSVGVILWEAIAGRRLSEGMSPREVLRRRIEGTDPKIAEVLPSVDPELAAICDRAMAVLPDERFTAAELQLALEQWLKQHGEPSRKALSKALRDAFISDREQLRSLVEQRMGGDSSLSGMRQSLSAISVIPPPVRLPASAEPSLLSSRPPLLLPPPPAPVAPEPPARGSFVILGVAAIVAFGVVGTVYVVKSTHPSASLPATDVRSATQPAPADAATMATPAPSDSTMVSPLTSEGGAPRLRGDETTAPVRPARPAFVGRAQAGAVHVGAPTVSTSPPSATASASLAPAPPPTKSKTPSRILDEKDPYDP